MSFAPAPLPRLTLPDDWPAPEELGFGQLLGPAAVTIEHERERGWLAPALMPRRKTRAEVASGAIQYGLSIFEGLKAYRGPDESVHVFRARAHAQRFRQSAERLALPVLDEELFVAAVGSAVRVHERFVPPHRRGSLYVRPTLFASEERLGVRAAERHCFATVVSPASNPPVRPVRLWAEQELVRAAPGGLGAAKTGANYAAGLLASKRARERGCDDVLWLDALEHRFLAEAGTMNVFVVFSEGVATPPLDDTILAGITRDSSLALLSSLGVSVEERAIALDELAEAAARDALLEVFGVGTAARLADVAEIRHRRGVLRPRGGELGTRLRRALADLQDGAGSDPFGWRETPGELALRAQDGVLEP